MSPQVWWSIGITVCGVALSFPLERALIPHRPFKSRSQAKRALVILIAFLAMQALIVLVDFVLLIPVGMGGWAFGLLVMWILAAVGTLVGVGYQQRRKDLTKG